MVGLAARLEIYSDSHSCNESSILTMSTVMACDAPRLGFADRWPRLSEDSTAD